MIRSLTSRGKILAAGILMCCLAAPVVGDETQYFPDDAHMVFSLDMPAFFKSTTYRELKKKIPAIEKQFETNMGEQFGVPSANIGRMTMAISFTEPAPETKKFARPDEIGILTAIKPVTAVEILKAKMKSSFKWKTNIAFKEVKAGKFTIHQETYQFQFDPKEKPGPVQDGEAFCVVESKMVIFGDARAMKKVLERNKAPMFSANMTAGMKAAPMTSPLTLVMDIQGLPARAKKELTGGIPVPGVEAAFGYTRTLALKVHESGNVMASATIICKDAASAAEARKVADAGLTKFKALLDDPKMPAEVKSMRKVLDEIKLSGTGDRLNAALSVQPAMFATFVDAMFTPKKVSVKSGSKTVAPK